MTGRQASPAHAGLPRPPAATARPRDPAGHPATGRRPADLPLAAAQKKDRPICPVAARRSRGRGAGSGLAGHGQPGDQSGRDQHHVYLPDLGKRRYRHRRAGHDERDVIPTGSHAEADRTNDTLPFLYQGPLTSPAEDSGFHALTPQFAGFVTGTFYGPDTSTHNPDTIPARQIRAVGSYRTGDGVFNHVMIYVGPSHALNIGRAGSGNLAAVTGDQRYGFTCSRSRL